MKKYNSDFRDKLASVRGNLRNPAFSALRDPLPNPSSIGEDGIDHINIWEQAKTDLGRALSHSARLSFTHSIFGRFDNMESFWQYIRSVERDDRVRVLHGYKLKTFARKLTFKRVPNFHAVIMDANWQKVQQYPDLLDELKESELPFDCYYLNNEGIRIRPAFSHWVIYGFTKIREALKADDKPDFSTLMDRTDVDLYDGIRPENSKPVQDEAEPSAFITHSGNDSEIAEPSLAVA